MSIPFIRGLISLGFLLAISVTPFGCGGVEPTKQEAKTKATPEPDSPEAASAKIVADTFLSAVIKHDGKSAFALISEEYRQRLPKQQADAKEIKWIQDTSYEFGYEFEIKRVQLLDNKNQIAIQGNFTTLLDQNKIMTKSPVGDFKIVMSKEGQTGKWVVDVFVSSVFKASK
jgi:hypothetical protein